MSEPIAPALTPAQWASCIRVGTSKNLTWGNPSTASGRINFHGVFDPFESFHDGGGEYSNSLTVHPDHRRALAALALDGQPYGFTREDVTLLAQLADNAIWKEGVEGAENLAARIAALLPPEDIQP